MDNKANDWILSTMANPSFTATDFINAGITSNNTSIYERDRYLNSALIQDSPEFLSNGKFDKAKFNNYYDTVLGLYQELAEETSHPDTAKAIFSYNNVWVSEDLRKKGLDSRDFLIKNIYNPDKRKFGIERIGYTSDPTMTPQEIALNEKVWDPATKTWSESPNDSWLFRNWFDPVALATWDFDADINGNPTNDPSKIYYLKGQPKVNEKTGTYYYEKLNGKEPYGKLILSPFDIITKDGSVANKYDFFDSDGLDKSFVGSLAKNAMRIAPLFIPYVNTAYIAFNIADEMAKVLPIIYKSTFGLATDDHSIANTIEAFAMQFDNNKVSEAGQLSFFNSESTLNMISDVALQLYELRWLFTKAPKVFKMKQYDISKKTGQVSELEKATEAKALGYIQEMTPTRELALLTMLKVGPDEMKATAFAKSQIWAENYMKDYQNVGRNLSRLFMTGTSSFLAYQDAKEEGASDLEAAGLFWGYFSGMYALMGTDIGEHVLPELRLQKLQIKDAIILVARGDLAGETVNAAKAATETAEKVGIFKKMFDKGASFARTMHNRHAGQTLSDTAKSIGANMLAEGVEEVTEELLYDVTKSTFNILSEFSGGTKVSAWDNILERYGQSFFGGMLGGGIFEATNAYHIVRPKLEGLEYDPNNIKANQMLIYLIRNGEKEELMNSLNYLRKHKMLGNANLGTKFIGVDKDGNTIYSEATDTDNQNEAAYQLMLKYINNIETVLDKENMNLSDSGLIGGDGIEESDIMKSLRYNHLMSSPVVGKLLLDYNNLADKFLLVYSKIQQLESVSDEEKRSNANWQEELDLTKKELEELRKQREEYFSAENLQYYTGLMLWAGNANMVAPFGRITFRDFAEDKYHKKFNELTAYERERAQGEYQEYLNGSATDEITRGYDLFMKMNKLFGQLLMLLGENAKNYVEGRKAFMDLQITIQLPNPETNELLDVNVSIQDLYDLMFKTEGLTDDLLTKKALELSKLENPFDVMRRFTITGDGSVSQQLNAWFNPNVAPIVGTDLEPLLDESDPASQMVRQKINLLTALRDNLLTLASSNQGGYVDSELMNTILDIKEEILKISDVDLGLVDYTDLVYLWTNNEQLAEAYNKFLTNLTANNLDLKIQELVQALDNMDDSDTDVKDLKDLIQSGIFENFKRSNQEIFAINDEINQIALNTTQNPIYDLLSQIIVTTTGEERNIILLLKDAETRFKLQTKGGEIAKFVLDGDLTREDFENALLVIEQVKSLVRAAQTDPLIKDNIMDFNRLMNMISGSQELGEIDSTSAYTFYQDLNLIESKILFIMSLDEYNSRQSLMELTKLGTKLDLISFNIIGDPDSEFYKVSPEVDKLIGGEPFINDAIREAIDNANTLKLYAEEKNPIISTDDQIQISKERMAIENAIYDRVQELLLNNTPEEVYSVIFKKYIDNKNQLGVTTTNITKDTDPNNITMMGELTYLMSIIGYKSGDFHYLYKLWIDNNDTNIIPLPAQRADIQFVWTIAHNKEFLNTLETLLKTEDNNKPPVLNTVLVQGVSGAGKTSAVMMIVYLMLKNNSTTPIKTITAGPLKNQAEKLATDINVDINNNTVYDKEELIKNLLGISVEELNKADSWDFTITSRPAPEDDKVERKLKQSIVDGFNNQNPPNYIFIDEVTFFTASELYALGEYCKRNNILLITAGDLKQGKTNKTWNIPGYNNIIDSIDVAMIPSPWELTCSMRPSNVAKRDNNILSTKIVEQYTWGILNGLNPDIPITNPRSFLEHLRTKMLHDAKFVGALSDNGLKGEVLRQRPSSSRENGNSKLLPAGKIEVARTLKQLIRNLGEGEKIAYVYDPADTSIRDFIETSGEFTLDLLENQLELKSAVDFFQEKSIQGSERKYCIVDINWKENYLDKLGNLDADQDLLDADLIRIILDFLGSFNTVISRSIHGSIIYDNGLSELLGNEAFLEKDIATINDIKPNTLMLQAYNETQKGIYESLLEGYTPSENATSEQTTGETPANTTTNTGGTAAPTVNPLPGPTVRLLNLEILYFTPNLTSLGRGTIGLVYVLNRKGIYVPTHAGFNTVYITESGNRLTGGGLFPGPEALALRRNILVNDGAGGWFELSVDTVEKVLVGGEDCTFRTKEEVVAYQARFNSIETTSLQNPQPEPSTGGLNGTDDGNPPPPSGDEIPQGDGPTIDPLPEPDPETPPEPLTGGGQPPITNGEVLVLTLDLLLNNLDAIRNSYDPSTLNLTLVRYLTEKQYDDYRDGTLKTGPYVLSFNTVEELIDSIRDGGFKYTIFSILVTPKTAEAYRATGKTKRSDFEKFKILLYNTKDPSNATDYQEQQWYSVVEGGNKKYYKITKLINNGENTLCNVSEYDLNGKYTGTVIKNIPLGVLALKNLVKCESPIQPSLRNQRTAGTGVNDLSSNRVREIVIPSLNEVMNLIEKNGDLGLKMYSGLITQTSVAFKKNLDGNYLLMLMGTPKRTYTMVNGLPQYNLLPENLNALLAPFVTYNLGSRYDPTTLFIAWNLDKNCLSVYNKNQPARSISDTVNIPSNFYEIYKLAEIALANIRTTLLDMDNSNPTNLKMISDRLLDILYLFISQNRLTLEGIGLSVGSVYLGLVGGVNVPNAEYSIKLYNDNSTDRVVDKGSTIVADDTEIPKRLVVAKIGNFEVSFAKLAHTATMAKYLTMILLVKKGMEADLTPDLLLKFDNSINQFKRVMLLLFKLDYMTFKSYWTLKNGVRVLGIYNPGEVGYIPVPNFNPSSGKLTGALIYGSDEATTDYLGEGVDYNEFVQLPGMLFSDPAILTNVIKPIQNISDLSGAKDLAGKPIVVFTLNEHLLYYQKNGKYYFTLNPSDSAAEGNTIYSVKDNKNVLFLAWRQAYTELLNSIDPQTGKATEEAKLEYNKRLGNGLVRFVVASPKAVSFSEYVKNTINLVNNIILDKNKKTSLGNLTTGTRLLHTLFNLQADLIEAIRKTQNNEPIDELRDEIFIGKSNIRYKQITIETLEEAKRLSIVINKLLHNASAKIIFSNVRESSRAAIDLGIVFKGRGDWEYTGIPIDSPIFSELGLTLNFNNIPYNDPEIVNKLRNGLITLMNESGYTVEGVSSDEIFDVPFSSNTGASENAVRFIGDFSQSKTWTNIPFTIAQFFGTLGFTQVDEYQECQLLDDGSAIAQENQLLMDFLDKNLSNYGSRDDVQAARNPLNRGIFYNALYLRTEEENSGEIAYLAGSISDTFKFRSALQTASLHLSLDDTLALCSQLGSDNDKVRGVPLYEYSNWYAEAVEDAKKLYAEAKEIPIEELNDDPIMGSGESSQPLTDPIETKVNELINSIEFYDKNDEFTPESKLEILDAITAIVRLSLKADLRGLSWSIDSILNAVLKLYNTQIASDIEEEDLILVFKDSSGKFKIFWLFQLLDSKNWKLIDGTYDGSVNKFALLIEDANNLRFAVAIDKTGKELAKDPITIEQPPVELLQELTQEQKQKVSNVLTIFSDIAGNFDLPINWVTASDEELAERYDYLAANFTEDPDLETLFTLLLEQVNQLREELNIQAECNNILVSLRNRYRFVEMI